MYCYFPDRRYGSDKVAFVPELQAKSGDLLEIDDTYALVLGEHISFKELIQQKSMTKEMTVVLAGVLHEKTLAYIHQFVQHRLCTYASALPLWLGDVGQLIKQHKKYRTPVVRDREIQTGDNEIIFTRVSTTTCQQLVVFPDLRTMHQLLPKKIFDQPGVIQLHSGLTAVQKAKAFWGIKYGQRHTILSTHAEIFQDFFALGSLVLIDQHKRRYKSQQDPRYRTPTVLEHMCQLRELPLWTTGYALLEENF